MGTIYRTKEDQEDQEVSEVLPVKVGDNDWNGKRDAEHAADGTQRRYKLAGSRPGGNVTVPGAGHGDDGPVQGLGQRVEHRVRLVLLQSVAQASEYQHAHTKET